MRGTACPDNSGLVRLAETDQADGQHLSGVSLSGCSVRVRLGTSGED